MGPPLNTYNKGNCRQPPASKRCSTRDKQEKTSGSTHVWTRQASTSLPGPQIVLTTSLVVLQETSKLHVVSNSFDPASMVQQETSNITSGSNKICTRQSSTSLPRPNMNDFSLACFGLQQACRVNCLAPRATCLFLVINMFDPPILLNLILRLR